MQHIRKHVCITHANTKVLRTHTHTRDMFEVTRSGEHWVKNDFLSVLLCEFSRVQKAHFQSHRFSLISQIVVPDFRQSENSQETGRERVQEKKQNRKKNEMGEKREYHQKRSRHREKKI